MILMAPTPSIEPVTHLASKHRSTMGSEKPVVTIVDDRPELCKYHKRCLMMLMDINENHLTMTNEVYDQKIVKLTEMVTTDQESDNIFLTFCAMSFLDRYQDKLVIANVLQKIDRKIRRPSWCMFDKLRDQCDHLLTKMGTIENLSSLDTDLVCLLCMLHKSCQGGSALVDSLLLEIGRSIWPYLKRPLWHIDQFVNLVADIFEAVGEHLEQLCPKNFSIAWKLINTKIVTMTEMSSESRLRLMAVTELRQRNWTMPDEVSNFYKQQYNEFTDERKKEILMFLGLLSSRRKISLSARPGRSAADLLKRRRSAESQTTNECASTSSGESFEPLMEVSDDVFEGQIERVATTSGDILKQDFPQHEVTVCKQNTVTLEKQTALVPSQSVDTETVDVFDDNNEDDSSSPTDKTAPVVEQNENTFSIHDDTDNTILDQRSLLFDRKREIIKVPKKFVGRVIGVQGSVITSIQEESGASVHIRRQQREKVSTLQRATFSASTAKNIIHNTLGIPRDKTEGDSVSIEQSSAKKSDISNIPDEDEDFEFEMIGSTENIEKAKWKIEAIISLAKTAENHTNFKRTFSEGEEMSFGCHRRSFYVEKKRVIMKVGAKYVGRVIGSGGTMIMTIEQESGAKVTFVKDKRTERYKERILERKNEDEIVNKTLDWENELEENIELSKEVDEMKTENQGTLEETEVSEDKTERVIESGILEETIQEEITGKDEIKESQTVQEQEEYDFEIFGTEEAIEKAKKKIEHIMRLVDNAVEKNRFTRSFSCSLPPHRGFKQFNRSLSCPIVDWGESCAGDCANCEKGFYCRSFLLAQSESPSCWVRPEALALTQVADWAEFIVKTKADDQAFWRPRRSSDTSIRSQSSKDSSEDLSFCTCPSPKEMTADQNTADNKPDIDSPADKIVSGDLSEKF